jgi:hypothetical protein
VRFIESDTDRFSARGLRLQCGQAYDDLAARRLRAHETIRARRFDGNDAPVKR